MDILTEWAISLRELLFYISVAHVVFFNIKYISRINVVTLIEFSDT